MGKEENPEMMKPLGEGLHAGLVDVAGFEPASKKPTPSALHV